MIDSEKDRMSDAVTGQWDVVVIDSGRREDLGPPALEWLRPGGMILFDNANLNWFPRLAQAFRDAGMVRIDFHGYAPGARAPNVTSVIFPPDSPRLRTLQLPPLAKKPVTRK